MPGDDPFDFVDLSTLPDARGKKRKPAARPAPDDDDPFAFQSLDDIDVRRPKRRAAPTPAPAADQGEVETPATPPATAPTAPKPEVQGVPADRAGHAAPTERTQNAAEQSWMDRFVGELDRFGKRAAEQDVAASSGAWLGLLDNVFGARGKAQIHEAERAYPEHKAAGGLATGVVASMAAPASIPAQMAVGAGVGGLSALGEGASAKEAGLDALVGGAAGGVAAGLGKAAGKMFGFRRMPGDLPEPFVQGPAQYDPRALGIDLADDAAAASRQLAPRAYGTAAEQLAPRPPGRGALPGPLRPPTPEVEPVDMASYMRPWNGVERLKAGRERAIPQALEHLFPKIGAAASEMAGNLPDPALTRGVTTAGQGLATGAMEWANALRGDNEQKAYATRDTQRWSIQQVLTSADPGLPEDALRSLTEAVQGDASRLASESFKLQQKYPAYARKVEQMLKSLNEEE